MLKWVFGFDVLPFKDWGFKWFSWLCHIIWCQSNGIRWSEIPTYALNALWSWEVIWLKMYQWFEGSFKRVPWVSYILNFEFLAGSDFLVVLVGESCPTMVIGGKGRCFSLKIMFWHFTSFELRKNDKRFLQEAGGSLAKHRRNPVLGSVWSVGPFLGCPEISLAEPIWGCRQIRQVWKTRQSTILTRETIFKFFENS